MAHIHQRRAWDVDRGTPTPESAYHSRREFIKAAGLTGIGAAALLSGCRPAGGDDGEDALRASLQQPKGSAFVKCARSDRYTVDRPVTDELVAARYNNFYEFGLDKEKCWRAAQRLTVRPWTVEVSGLVEKPLTLAVDDIIRKMPCEERLYRFRCVERWAMVVPWSGFAFKAFLDWVKPLSSAKFVRFITFHRPAEAPGQKPGGAYQWPYYEGLSLAEAANELTFFATGIYGHDLPRQHGAPLRMVVPWKYGYKGAKSVVKIEFVETQPRTFWNDASPQEYGFVSNVDPNKPHPRWSQAEERMIGTGTVHKTQRYNGYGDYVAGLYK